MNDLRDYQVTKKFTHGILAGLTIIDNAYHGWREAPQTGHYKEILSETEYDIVNVEEV